MAAAVGFFLFAAVGFLATVAVWRAGDLRVAGLAGAGLAGDFFDGCGFGARRGAVGLGVGRVGCLAGLRAACLAGERVACLAAGRRAGCLVGRALACGGARRDGDGRRRARRAEARARDRLGVCAVAARQPQLRRREELRVQRRVVMLCGGCARAAHDCGAGKLKVRS